MPDTKEKLLERIEELKRTQAESLTPYSRSMEWQYRYLILDTLEYLLICGTAQKLD